ncbi:hypothetical protein BOSE127_170178 [Bosea sp. 127]|nr:hypothetical protein BOSE127_170178 [Bosea sp. 127]
MRRYGLLSDKADLSEAAASSVAWRGLPMEGRALSLDPGAH